MKVKKSFLLLEVSLVVLVVSIISVFIFRGFANFKKAAQQSSAYQKLILLSEQKIWDLKSSDFFDLSVSERVISGNFPDSRYSWEIESSSLEEFDQNRLILKNEGKSTVSFDLILLSKSLNSEKEL